MYASLKICNPTAGFGLFPFIQELLWEGVHTVLKTTSAVALQPLSIHVFFFLIVVIK